MPGRPLSADDVETRLRARFGDAVEVVDQDGHAVATVPAASYREVVRFLRDEPEFACTYCDFTSAVDFGPERGFEVLTHLYSMEHRHNVRVRVRIPSEEPTVDSISDLFPTCDWHEIGRAHV